MHLKAERNVDFQVDGHFFGMAEGETIHTENSFKYGLRDVGVLLQVRIPTKAATYSNFKAATIPI